MLVRSRTTTEPVDVYQDSILALQRTDVLPAPQIVLNVKTVWVYALRVLRLLTYNLMDHAHVTRIQKHLYQDHANL